MHTTLIIYAAFCLGFTVLLTGGQITEILQYRGENVKLVCTFIINFNFLNCQWYFTQNGGEERPITNGTRYTWSCSLSPYSVVWVDIQISFKNVTFNDSGMYTCEAMTTSGADRKEILLTVLEKPQIAVHKTNYTAVSGTNVTLECVVNVNGEFITFIQWEYKVNQQWSRAGKSGKYFWTIQMPSLVISDVQTSDSRFYRCLALTRVGTAEGPATFLNVQTTPIIIIPVNEYKTINGTTAVLLVRIDDRMQTSLSVQWEKYKEENQQWFPLENNSRLLWTYAEPSLRIATALLEDDGKYRIIIKTAYHEVISSPITLTIYVSVKIKELETRPVFIREGDKVEIRCLVDGRPEPKVTWRLANGTTIVASSLKNVQDNILILERVTNLNEGNYTCIAQNSFSMDESLIYMTVSDLPVFNPKDKDRTGSPLETYVVPGVSVFVCVALIALIVVIILIRKKRQKGRTDKPNLEIRSTNGQKHPSPSENIQSGNNHAKFSVHLSGDMTCAQEIRNSIKNIDGNKSIRDTNIPQSNTHIDRSNSIGDTDASKVYMNINITSTSNTNSYIDVVPESENTQYMNINNSSTSNSNSYINVETESENTQMNKTEVLNYEGLDFSLNAQDENSYLGIQGSPSDTTCREVAVFTR